MPISTYYTLNNGADEFKVVVNSEKKCVDVMKIIRESHVKKDLYNIQNKLCAVLQVDYESIFIGKSPKNKTTEFSKGYGKEKDGNSILVHMRDNHYLFIGDQLYQFEVDKDEHVISYQSPVGNSWVSYPYAITTKNVLFMIEKEQIPLNKFPIPINKTTKEDLYQYLYHDPDMEGTSKKMKKVKQIPLKIK